MLEPVEIVFWDSKIECQTKLFLSVLLLAFPVYTSSIFASNSMPGGTAACFLILALEFDARSVGDLHLHSPCILMQERGATFPSSTFPKIQCQERIPSSFPVYLKFNARRMGYPSSIRVSLDFNTRGWVNPTFSARRDVLSWISTRHLHQRCPRIRCQESGTFDCNYF